MQYVVKGDTKAVMKDLGKLRKKEIPRAQSAALNRTSQQLITRVRRRLAKAANVQQKILKGRIVRKRKARATRPEAVIEVRHQGIPVSDKYFKPRQTARGVKAGRRVFEGAFVIGADHKGKTRGKDKGRRKRRGEASGGVLSFLRRPTSPTAKSRMKGKVYERKGEDRLPLKRVSIPLQPHGKRIASREVRRSGPILFRRNFASQVKRFLARRR